MGPSAPKAIAVERMIAALKAIRWGGPPGPRPAPWPASLPTAQRLATTRGSRPGGRLRTRGSAPHFLQRCEVDNFSPLSTATSRRHRRAETRCQENHQSTDCGLDIGGVTQHATE